MAKKDIVISKDSAKWMLIAAAALLIGLALGQTIAPKCSPQFSQGGLTDSDKMFLVNMTNAQLAVSAAQNDWCSAAGGLWNTFRGEARVPVNAETASQLQGQGVTISQINGTSYAQVDLIDRQGCMFIRK